jgi:malonyl-CoA O-methyltransferase
LRLTAYLSRQLVRVRRYAITYIRRNRYILREAVASTLSNDIPLRTRFERSLRWLRRCSLPSSGIKVTHRSKLAYPEVTGYLIPTLLDWGEEGLARQYGKWLASIQNGDGSWSDPSGRAPYTFDTGQILKGLFELCERSPELQVSVRRGCDWIRSRIEASGRITTPDKGAWGLDGGRVVPEAIHLYALEPLRRAEARWPGNGYGEAVVRALNFYLADPELTRFETLSHFHAYVIEALVDLGQVDRARAAMNELAPYQAEDGSVRAYRDSEWVCSTGLFQYSLIWFKLGESERAERAFEAACRLQNSSGGFFGSYGKGAKYFPREEIPWAIKYFMDALSWKMKSEFNGLAPDFLDSISPEDGRYRLIEDLVLERCPEVVADLGCGKGRFIRRIKEAHPATDALGIDLSEKMLDGLPQAGIRGMPGSLLRLPLADRSVDFAFCVEALEHSLNARGAVREMARVVRPGGTLVIIDKNRGRLGHFDVPGWERWFSEGEVRTWLGEEGFAVEVRRNIPYDKHDGKDGLFLGWVARKT